MSYYAQIGSFTTEPKDRQALIDILTQAIKIIETLEGCQQYILYKDSENDELTWVSEIWESKEAHAASLTREDVRALIGQAVPLLKTPPQGGVKLIPLVGKGLK